VPYSVEIHGLGKRLNIVYVLHTCGSFCKRNDDYMED